MTVYISGKIRNESCYQFRLSSRNTYGPRDNHVMIILHNENKVRGGPRGELGCSILHFRFIHVPTRGIFIYVLGYSLVPYRNSHPEEMGFKFQFKSLRDVDSDEGTVKLVDGTSHVQKATNGRRHTSIKGCEKHRHCSNSPTLGRCE